MLPEKNCGDSARQDAERQTNYLILSSLQQKLSPELFAQILTQVSRQKTLTFPGLGHYAPPKPAQLGWRKK